MNEGYLLSVITFLPVLGSAALLVLRADDHVWIRRLALATTLATFGISLLLLRGFNSQDASFQFREHYEWIQSPPIFYHLGVDGISLWLVLLTTFITPICVLCSWESIRTRLKEFFLMLLVLETGMIGVFLSLDLFLFFVFWEVMLVPMYFLIGIWGHERRIYAAIKFVLFTMAGSVLMLVAILWLYNLSRTFDLLRILGMLQTGAVEYGAVNFTWFGAARSVPVEYLLFGAFFLAFAIKVPLFPLHTWLPDAHVEAPTAGSVVLAGVLLKMGTYGLLRFCLPLFPNASVQLAPYIATLAIIGIIYGALVSMVQPDLKKLIAYSSVSHLGFVVLGIFAMNMISIEGAIYQMLNHGVSTGGLFLVAGMLYDRRHTHLISELGGLATPMPVLSGFYLFICLSSLGLPMLNGFVGEFLILLGTFSADVAGTRPGIGIWWAAFAASGVILSAVYLLWSYQRAFYGDVTHEKNRALPDASRRERLILAVVAIVILWMGIASPMFISRMERSTANLINQINERRFPGARLATTETKAGPSESVVAPRAESEKRDAAKAD
jgi:NADH-quinone oxidoreductase subunit M